jgi:hypothetical protein
MAYQRKGRNTALPGRISKPAAQSEATADLTTKIKYQDAVSAAPGARSVVGRPVSVFDTLPAGTSPFRLNFEYTLPQDIEYGEQITLAEFVAPVGRVMVVESWEVRFVPRGVSNPGTPYYAARIMNTRPIKASLVRNRQKLLGAADVHFYPFDGEAESHAIYYADQLGSVVAEAATALLWEDNFQKLEIILNGNYLLPNLQAPEYTELEIGIVRVGQ